MKIYLNAQYKCVKVEDNTFVANSTSNFIRYYFVQNADGTLADEITENTEVYLNQEPSYVTLGFRRADGNTIQHLMATPKTEGTEAFWEYVITETDGVLYKKGALEVSAQFINATLNSENKIISQKVMAVAINTAHILDNIGEEAEEYYSQYEQANNEAHAALQAQITEKFNNIGVMGSLTTDNKNTLVEAINEVDEHADKAQNDVNKLSDDIGDKLSLTTDEKNTIVGAINEVDNHADTAQTTADSAIQTANNAKTVADTAKSIADSASQTANQAKTTANNASATANAIAGTANQAMTIAEQAKTIATNSVYSVSFEDIQSAVTALNGYDNAYFKVGNSIYLKQKDVPDMWVYAVASEYVEYTYTTDYDFVNALLLGTVQVGYYVLANLESTGDYDVLKDIPIINQDLSADGFTPVENTYYRHTGTTSETYTAGVVYFYNGTAYKAIDGAGGEVPTALPQEASALKSGNLPTSGWNTSASKELFYGNLNFAGYSSSATDNGKILPPYNYTSKNGTSYWTGTQICGKNIEYCQQKTDGDGKKYISLYFESGYGINSHKEAEIQIYDDGTVKAWHYSDGAYAETVKIVSTFLSDYIYTISDTSITANSDILMELTDDGGVKAYSMEAGKITVIRDTVPTQPIPYTYKVKQTNASGQFTVINHYTPNVPNTIVESVNGQTGAVTIAVPTKTSELTNNSGYVSNLPIVRNVVCNDVDSAATLDTTITCEVGDLILAQIIVRSALTLPTGWTLLRTIPAVETSTNQTLSFAYKKATSTSETLTVTQATAGRIYTNLVRLSNAVSISYIQSCEKTNTGATSISSTKPVTPNMVIWGASSTLWQTSSTYGNWSYSPSTLDYYSLPQASKQPRLATFIDSSGAGERTFTAMFSSDSSAALMCGAVEIVGDKVARKGDIPTSLPVTYKKASGELPTSGWSEIIVQNLLTKDIPVKKAVTLTETNKVYSQTIDAKYFGVLQGWKIGLLNLSGGNPNVYDAVTAMVTVGNEEYTQISYKESTGHKYNIYLDKQGNIFYADHGSGGDSVYFTKLSNSTVTLQTYSISDADITANTSVKMYLTDEGGVKAQSKASGSITVIRDEVPTTAIPYEYEVEQTSAEGLFEVINAYVPTKTSELTNDSGFITAEDIPSATTLYEDSTGAATVTLSETINNGDIVRIKTNNGNVDHYYIGVAWNRTIMVTESFMVTDESDVTVGTAINIDSLRFNIQDTSLILFHYFNTNITTTGAVTITNEKTNVVIRKVERIHT